MITNMNMNMNNKMNNNMNNNMNNLNMNNLNMNLNMNLKMNLDFSMNINMNMNVNMNMNMNVDVNVKKNKNKNKKKNKNKNKNKEKVQIRNCRYFLRAYFFKLTRSVRIFTVKFLLTKCFFFELTNTYNCNHFCPDAMGRTRGYQKQYSRSLHDFFRGTTNIVAIQETWVTFHWRHGRLRALLQRFQSSRGVSILTFQPFFSFSVFQFVHSQTQNEPVVHTYTAGTPCTDSESKQALCQGSSQQPDFGDFLQACAQEVARSCPSLALVFFISRGLAMHQEATHHLSSWIPLY